ncbi:MAG: serine hydroxymethyltransferase [Candidatus Kerfeldbacteria bacterium]|nr:serine hydroxymethyltransferase [Candidatus Kerfeldbacteria bacterium]
MDYPHLQHTDPEIFDAIIREIQRQNDGIEMIPSENIASRAVLEAAGSPLTNKYSEGYPGKRYYGGNIVIDEVENLARERAKKLFNAEHANVQPHAGSQANMAAYFALANPGDTILAMQLDHGGHLTHGSPVNFSGRLFHFVPYGVGADERIDMDVVRKLALEHKPKMILAGATAYPRLFDFRAFRTIADEVGAYFMVDMAHIAGLVATKLHPDPVPYADVVTSTTHKTLRGTRAGFILSRIEDRLHDTHHPNSKKNLAQLVDSAVFPEMQGGPLEHIIAAKAVGFHEAMQPEFRTYQQQVLQNAQRLAQQLMAHGLRLVSGGTDNHLMLIDLQSVNLDGKTAERLLDEVGIHTNKNTIPNDPRKPMNPSGIRLGTPVLTTRGMNEPEVDLIAEVIASTLQNPTDPTMQRSNLQKIRDLCRQFPLYPDL